ncbi:hypothetical protein [Streptomyces luteireticuli]|uniref:hypothetical protein n=1 Tax=Streptomyces luteireticuli TaxID=173858 RepID=UPI003556C1AA
MTTPPPEPWARRAAHLAVLSVLPSGLWRTALAFGVPLGYDERTLHDKFGLPGAGATAFLLSLTALIELLAFLTLGLVRPWGERVPQWIPVLGGRAVNPRLVVAVACTGAVLLTLVLTVTAGTQVALQVGDGALRGGWLWLLFACYAPLAAWGPLLAAVTVSYHRRHRPVRRLSVPEPTLYRV